MPLIIWHFLPFYRKEDAIGLAVFTAVLELLYRFYIGAHEKTGSKDLHLNKDDIDDFRYFPDLADRNNNPYTGVAMELQTSPLSFCSVFTGSLLASCKSEILHHLSVRDCGVKILATISNGVGCSEYSRQLIPKDCTQIRDLHLYTPLVFLQSDMSDSSNRLKLSLHMVKASLSSTYISFEVSVKGVYCLSLLIKKAHSFPFLTEVCSDTTLTNLLLHLVSDQACSLLKLSSLSTGTHFLLPQSSSCAFLEYMFEVISSFSEGRDGVLTASSQWMTCHFCSKQVQCHEFRSSSLMPCSGVPVKGHVGGSKELIKPSWETCRQHSIMFPQSPLTYDPTTSPDPGSNQGFSTHSNHLEKTTKTIAVRGTKRRNLASSHVVLGCANGSFLLSPVASYFSFLPNSVVYMFFLECSVTTKTEVRAELSVFVAQLFPAVFQHLQGYTDMPHNPVAFLQAFTTPQGCERALTTDLTLFCNPNLRRKFPCEVVPLETPRKALIQRDFAKHFCGVSYYLRDILSERLCGARASIISEWLLSNLSWCDFAIVISISNKKLFSHIELASRVGSKFLPFKSVHIKTSSQLEPSVPLVSKMSSDPTTLQISKRSTNAVSTSLGQHVTPSSISFCSVCAPEKHIRAHNHVENSYYNIYSLQQRWERPILTLYRERNSFSERFLCDINTPVMHLKSNHDGKRCSFIAVPDKHKSCGFLNLVNSSSLPKVRVSTDYESKGRGSMVICHQYTEWFCLVQFLDRSNCTTPPLKLHTSDIIFSQIQLPTNDRKFTSDCTLSSSTIVSTYPLLYYNSIQNWCMPYSTVYLGSHLSIVPQPGLQVLCCHGTPRDKCMTCSGVHQDTDLIGLEHRIIFLTSQGKVAQNKSTSMQSANVAYNLPFRQLPQHSIKTSIEERSLSGYETYSKNLQSPASETLQPIKEQSKSLSSSCVQDEFLETYFEKPIKECSEKAVEEILPIPRTQTVRKGEHLLDEHVIGIGASNIVHSLQGKQNNEVHEPKECSEDLAKQKTFSTSSYLQGLVGLYSHKDIRYGSLETEKGKCSPSALVGLLVRHNPADNYSIKVKKKEIPKTKISSITTPRCSSLDGNIYTELAALNPEMHTTLIAYNCNAEEMYIQEDLVFEDVQNVILHISTSTASKKKNYDYCCFDKYLNFFVSQADADPQALNTLHFC